jgi:hypothetical protein
MMAARSGVETNVLSLLVKYLSDNGNIWEMGSSSQGTVFYQSSVSFSQSEAVLMDPLGEKTYVFDTRTSPGRKF